MKVTNVKWNRPLGPFAMLYEQPAPVLTEDQIRRARRATNERNRKARLKAEQVNKDTSGHTAIHQTNSYRAPR